jgi:ribosomal protein S18 acetylase RimI-like enzyme
VQIAIRPALVVDADAIAAVHVSGWRWGYAGQIPDGILASLEEDERAARWRSVLETGDAAVFVAEDRARVLGFAACGRSRDNDSSGDGELYALYLHAEAAGTGAGAALLRAAIAELRGRGFERAVLWVLSTNARARRFYEREGWEQDGATKTEDLDGFPLVEVRYRRTT